MLFPEWEKAPEATSGAVFFHFFGSLGWTQVKSSFKGLGKVVEGNKVRVHFVLCQHFSMIR
jgi:hypothetical protein